MSARLHPVVGLGAALVAVLHPHAADAVMPNHSWPTVGHMSFFHSSNTSGPFADGAVDVMAKFQMVTIEKWQADAAGSKDHSMAANIVAVLRKVKAVDPTVSTIMYYNSVCDFPQYTDLYSQYVAMPETFLRTASGEAVYMSCAGFDNASYRAGMPVYNHANAAARALWQSECLNATATGVVDGCFVDRAVDVQGFEKDLDADTGAAYTAGHRAASEDLQAALPRGPVVANHAFGPPFCNISGVYAAMIEGCTNNLKTLQQLQACRANQRSCQCHVAGTGIDSNTLAVFLVGAYHGTAADGRVFGSYFGHGAWSSPAQFDGTWAESVRPAGVYDMPLGEPLGDAVVRDGHVYTRAFTGNASGNTTVLFDAATGLGCVSWPGQPPCAPPPAPTPAPAFCADVFANTGMADYDFADKTTPSAAACCEWCGTVQGGRGGGDGGGSSEGGDVCVAWAWHSDAEQKSGACHLHSKAEPHPHVPYCTSGVLNRTAGLRRQ